MARYVVTREIAAPAEKAWSFLSSVLAWPTWLPTVSAVEAVQGDALERGAKFRVVQPRLRPQVWTVTEFQPGRRFTWESKTPGLSLWAAHEVRSTGPASCAVELEFRFAGPVGALLGVLFGPTTRKYIAIEAESLKTVCELAATRAHVRRP